MEKTEKLLNNIISWTITALVFLTPLFFLPITSNFYSFNKNVLLYLGVSLLLFLWLLKMAATKQIRLVKTSLGPPLTLLTLVFILTTVFTTTNKAKAFLNPGSTGTIISLSLLYFIIVNNLSRLKKQRLLYAIITSAAILGLITIYQYVGLGENWALAPWMQNKLWTPAGTPLVLASFSAVVLPLTLFLFLKKFSQSIALSAGLILALILISLGLLVTVSQMLPGKAGSIVLLPYTSAWVIAIEAFKQNPLFGVGPANFLSAFNRFRPISFNQFEFWNVSFGASSSYLLQLLTTTGIFGLASFVWLGIRLFKSIRANRKNTLAISLLFSLLLLVFLPAEFLSIFLFFILIAVWTKATHESSFQLTGSSNFIPLVLGILLVSPIVYLTGLAYSAEVAFYRSLQAITQNRGTDAYNLQIRALELNPYKANFRIAYSQTNFALANALAAQENLTDQDRININQLIQQAIKEAKIVNNLNPNSTEGWKNLAQLYRNLINFAEGADQWTIVAYRQAILTDPANPTTRINLGGLLFTLGDFDQAIRQFENAINLKPDHANAYYNLSAAYQKQEKFVEAYQAMQIALNLVPANSPDFQRVNEELNELAKKLPVREETPPAEQQQFPPEQTIVKPEPLPSPAITPIELPEESGPEVSPPPEPSPTP